MQKLTNTEVRWTICELENAAREFAQLAYKFDSSTKSLLKFKAENLYSIAEKLRIAINNEDKRIEILW